MRYYQRVRSQNWAWLVVVWAQCLSDIHIYLKSITLITKEYEWSHETEFDFQNVVRIAICKFAWAQQSKPPLYRLYFLEQHFGLEQLIDSLYNCSGLVKKGSTLRYGNNDSSCCVRDM